MLYIFLLLFKVNAYFSASTTHIQAMKKKNIALAKAKVKLEKESQVWESRALLAEDQATSRERIVPSRFQS